MPPAISAARRSRILSYARGQLPREDRGDPVKTGAAAAALMEWAEQAGDEHELAARMTALSQAYLTGLADDREPGLAAFLDDAGVYYAFLAAGLEAAL